MYRTAIVKTLIILAVSFPVNALSQNFTQLKKKQRAPFAGLLFDPKAWAKITNEHAKEIERCNSDKNKKLEKLNAKFDREVSLFQADLDWLEKVSDRRVQNEKDYSQKLEKIIEKSPNDYSTWIFTGGVVVGVVTSIAIFFAAKRIDNGS